MGFGRHFVLISFFLFGLGFVFMVVGMGWSGFWGEDAVSWVYVRGLGLWKDQVWTTTREAAVGVRKQTIPRFLREGRSGRDIYPTCSASYRSPINQQQLSYPEAPPVPTYMHASRSGNQCHSTLALVPRICVLISNPIHERFQARPKPAQ